MEDELQALHDQGLHRELRSIKSVDAPFINLGNSQVLNFSSNDYLGLSQHPHLIKAFTAAAKTHGVGSTASRSICGSRQIFHDLEDHLAHLKKTERSLTFANGYATAMGTIPAIVGKGDTIILDKLSHACLIDAARLSGAKLRIFPHNDLHKLEKLLKSTQGRKLIVTESVFSMDGDLCPLSDIVALKEKHNALLFLDEAHAVGILGKNGQGLAEELSLQEKIDFQMGTLGKALGSAGGYLAASASWIDLLINKARSFIYSTAPPPAQAAASLAALQLLESTEGQTLRARLRQNCQIFNSQTPIIPLIVGENKDALDLSKQLLDEGYLIPAIRYPTVPRGTARLRLTLSAAHTLEQVQTLEAKLESLPNGPFS